MILVGIDVGGSGTRIALGGSVSARHDLPELAESVVAADPRAAVTAMGEHAARMAGGMPIAAVAIGCGRAHHPREGAACARGRGPRRVRHRPGDRDLRHRHRAPRSPRRGPRSRARGRNRIDRTRHRPRRDMAPRRRMGPPARRPRLRCLDRHGSAARCGRAPRRQVRRRPGSRRHRDRGVRRSGRLARRRLPRRRPRQDLRLPRAARRRMRRSRFPGPRGSSTPPHRTWQRPCWPRSPTTSRSASL